MKNFGCVRSWAPEVALLTGVALLCAGALMADPYMRGLSATVWATQAGLLCLAYAGASWHGGSARRALGLSPPPRPLSLLTAPAAIGGTLLLSLGLGFWLQWSGVGDDSVLVKVQEHLSALRGPEVVYALVGMALLPALAEELLFRGLVLGWLSSRWGSFWGLIGSSCLFGAIHLDPAQAVAAAIIGLYLGGLRLRTGSVHAPILCHAANNAVAVMAPQILVAG